MHQLAKSLIVIGLLIAAAGGLMLVIERIPGIGRLPGDIVVERKNFSFYFPVGTSILISIILSLVMWLFGRR
ncbi:MAG: DUF2905 domain-containing protein [Nitrospirae bacterium]|nr:DUF2905 domain-containing protein [Nitrospirota bacterium]